MKPFFRQSSLSILLLLTVGLSALVAQPRALTLADFQPHHGAWQQAGEVAISDADPERLALAPGSGLIVNGEIGKTTNLLTRREYADVEVHVEFFIPEGSNSGVYLQGRYEVQIRDSYGIEEPRHADAGGIYQRWQDAPEPRGWGGVAPRVNAARPAGEWQSFDIIFRAPRFDESGRKVEDAQFAQVVHNGVVVQRNVPVTGPTRASAFRDEQPRGPLMFQGDHGPVAYRNLRVRELELDHSGKVIGQWQMLDLDNDFEVVLESPYAADPRDVLRVGNGEVHALYNWPAGKEAPAGLLVSKKRYSHYDIAFEMRFGERQFPPGSEDPKNAGFLYHIQATTPIWPPCLECQGRTGSRGDHFSIRGVNAQQINAEGNLVPIPDREFAWAGRWSDSERPSWNAFRIEVRGDRARYFVNGQQVNEVRHATYGGLPCSAGFIGFQAEFAEVSYRNLRIRPIGTR